MLFYQINLVLALLHSKGSSNKCKIQVLSAWKEMTHFFKLVSILLNPFIIIPPVNIRYDIWPQKQVFFPLKHKVFSKISTLITKEQIKSRLGIVQEQKNLIWAERTYPDRFPYDHLPHLKAFKLKYFGWRKELRLYEDKSRQTDYHQWSTNYPITLIFFIYYQNKPTKSVKSIKS